MGNRISEAKALRIEWTAHNEPWLWPALAVFGFGGAWWSLHGGPVFWWSAALLGAAGGYLTLCRFSHHDLDCARCWRRTPPPSMAAGEVVRYRRSLWFAHVVYGYGLALCLPLVAATFMPFPALYLSGLVSLLVIAVCMAVSLNKHKQLARWCPRCPRHGGGGGGGTYALPPPPILRGAK